MDIWYDGRFNLAWKRTAPENLSIFKFHFMDLLEKIYDAAKTLCVLRSLKWLMWLKAAQSTTGNSLLGLAFRGTPPNNNSLNLFKFKFASFCFYVFLQ